MYERVLIPLDGSEPAEAILPFAERIAGSLDLEVCLLRVVEPMPAMVGLGTGGVVGPDVLALRQSDAKQYLADVARQLEARGLRVRTFLGFGGPEREILDVAKAEKADLIAMSTHARRGLRHVVFGSVAEDVLRSAGVPVLLMRMPAPTPAPTEVTR
jgi:nucleotide-binding universal stress UspA family protein